MLIERCWGKKMSKLDCFEFDDQNALNGSTQRKSEFVNRQNWFTRQFLDHPGQVLVSYFICLHQGPWSAGQPIPTWGRDDRGWSSDEVFGANECEVTSSRY